MMPYLDLRDLAAELAELEGCCPDQAMDDLCNDEDRRERLVALRALQDQLFTETLAEHAENESTLIPESEFEDHAKELAYDCGFALKDSPLESYIDWDRWAEDARQGYTDVEWEGVTYLLREY